MGHVYRMMRACSFWGGEEPSGITTDLADGKRAAASWNALDFDVSRQSPYSAKSLKTLKEGISRTCRRPGDHGAENAIGASGVDVECSCRRRSCIDEGCRRKYNRGVSRFTTNA